MEIPHPIFPVLDVNSGLVLVVRRRFIPGILVNSTRRHYLNGNFQKLGQQNGLMPMQSYVGVESGFRRQRDVTI